MNCSNCVNQLLDDAKFCSSCGQKVTCGVVVNSLNTIYTPSTNNTDIQVKNIAGVMEIIIQYAPNLTLGALSSINLVNSDKLRVALDLINDNIKLCIPEIR